MEEEIKDHEDLEKVAEQVMDLEDHPEEIQLVRLNNKNNNLIL